MPELPDVTLYAERIEALFRGQTVQKVRVQSPFVVRSYAPPLTELQGRALRAVRRLGKQIVLEFDADLYFVLHLMIAGRLHHKPAGAPLAKRGGLLALDFEKASVLLTEAGSKRRARVHLVRGAESLGEFDRGGLEVLDASLEAFDGRLRGELRTLKRALVDPDLFSGIGNAYSDEILHAAGLSPMQRTQALSPAEVKRLWQATQHVLRDWTERLRHEVGEGFPVKVTAFRADMAVHGRYGKACPVCASPVQRIVYASNECNYCAVCQTQGKLLRDRALSRLLRNDWPRDLAELEDRKSQRS